MSKNFELAELGNMVTADGSTNTVTVSNSISISGNLIISSTSDIVINTTAGIWANGTFGTAGQALTSNGTAVYWSTIVGTNTDAQYTWTNTHTFNANVTIGSTGELIINNAAGIYANGSLGTAGQVLTSNATTVYWSTPTGGTGTFDYGLSYAFKTQPF